MLKVIAVPEPERQTFRVYIFLGDSQRHAGWKIFSRPDGGIEEIPPNGEPPMWIRLPEDIARALAEEFSDPRPVATERHLDDSLYIRDRLLDMVERMAAPPPLQMGGIKGVPSAE